MDILGEREECAQNGEKICILCPLFFFVFSVVEVSLRRFLLRQCIFATIVEIIATVGVAFSCFWLLLIAKTLGIIGFLVDFFSVLFGLFLGAEENREKASPVFYCCI